jgi:hypothetical protein
MQRLHRADDVLGGETGQQLLRDRLALEARGVEAPHGLPEPLDRPGRPEPVAGAVGLLEPGRARLMDTVEKQLDRPATPGRPVGVAMREERLDAVLPVVRP